MGSRLQNVRSELSQRGSLTFRQGDVPREPLVLELVDDVDEAVLLSDRWSGYVTGANVPVDGGLGLVTWSRP